MNDAGYKPDRDLLDALMKETFRRLAESVDKRQLAKKRLSRATEEYARASSNVYRLDEELQKMKSEYREHFEEWWTPAKKGESQ